MCLVFYVLCVVGGVGVAAAGVVAVRVCVVDALELFVML